jgi:hypothetical protein
MVWERGTTPQGDSLMSREDERHLSTADLAGAGDRQQPQPPTGMTPGQAAPQPGDEPLAALFLAPVAEDFRRRWDAVQIGFVDDPHQAVRSADELVAQVMKTLAETFAEQRGAIEAGVDQSDQANTENLRVALQRYRSFFQRLLSL